MVLAGTISWIAGVADAALRVLHRSSYDTPLHSRVICLVFGRIVANCAREDGTWFQDGDDKHSYPFGIRPGGPASSPAAC
jgi:hypothetical protein